MNSWRQHLLDAASTPALRFLAGFQCSDRCFEFLGKCLVPALEIDIPDEKWNSLLLHEFLAEFFNAHAIHKRSKFGLTDATMKRQQESVEMFVQISSFSDDQNDNLPRVRYQ
jgi:hypothetical protein